MFSWHLASFLSRAAERDPANRCVRHRMLYQSFLSSGTLPLSR